MTDPQIPAAWQPPAPGEAPDVSQAVTVAYLHQSQVSYSWHHCMVELLAWDFNNVGRVMAGGFVGLKCSSSGLVEGRNQATAEFLKDARADWMWWVDTDMGFAPDTIDRLLAAADPVERPIVGGLCFGQRELALDGMGGHKTGAVPTIYDWMKLENQEGFGVRWDYPPNTLVKCSGTGAACILVHRSVFERIGERFGTWYSRIPNPTTGQLIGEDLSFCVRAGALDIPVFVHTGVPTTHHKEVWVSEERYWQERAVNPPPFPTSPNGQPAEPQEAAR